MLERARQPLLTALDTRRQTNGWWLEALDGSASDPTPLKDAKEQGRFYREIALDEVRKAAPPRGLSRPPPGHNRGSLPEHPKGLLRLASAAIIGPIRSRGRL